MSDTFKSPVICPKCRAVRPPDATVPEWQCPSCGIAYVKAGGSSTPASDAKVVYQTRAPQERRGTLKFLLLALGAGAAGAWVWRKQNRSSEPQSEIAAGKPAGPREVVMFATSWCGYCAAARRFFADHGIKYVEYDIERDPDGARKYEKMGFKGTGVPVILIDGEVIHGFNEQTLRAALVG
jgi:glutaredoxin/ribosomal protein L37AE/L43A